MKRILALVFVILILVSLQSFAMPHPLSNYDLSQHSGTPGEIESEVRDVWSTMLFHTDSDVWFAIGEAELITKAVAEAIAERIADHQFYSDEEKRDLLRSLLRVVEDQIVLNIELMSNHRLAQQYIVLDSRDTKVQRVLLETSNGDRVVASELSSKEPQRIMAGSDFWWAGSTVRFPTKKSNGERYINAETTWIRVWVLSSHDRGYFELKFDPIK